MPEENICAGGPPVAPKIHALAVLPLGNLSGDSEQEYFADGMTEGDVPQTAELLIRPEPMRSSFVARRPLLG